MSTNQLKKGAFFAGLVMAALFLIAFIGSFYTIVGPGERGVLMNFSAVSNEIFSPGLHFKMPIRQSVKLISVQTQKTQYPESAASKDLQVVTTTVAINFNLNPDKVNAIYRDIGDLPSVSAKIIDPAVSNAVKAVTAEYNADELIANRDKVRDEISQHIKEAVSSSNVIVTAVNITDFNFSQEYNRAIEDKQVSQQQALKANYQLQQKQIDAQKQVVEAKAYAEARIERAKGDAQAIVLTAKADAQAMELKNKTITDRILQLAWIHQWKGDLPLSTGDSAVPFINLNKMSKLSTVADKADQTDAR